MFSVKVETKYCYVEYHNIVDIVTYDEYVCLVNDERDVFNVPKDEFICIIIRKVDTDEN